MLKQTAEISSIFTTIWRKSKIAGPDYLFQ
jgi:hypothetical protein